MATRTTVTSAAMKHAQPRHGADSCQGWNRAATPRNISASGTSPSDAAAMREKMSASSRVNQSQEDEPGPSSPASSPCGGS
jgi:hypothetical protein